jgi:hypothetical protein
MITRWAALLAAPVALGCAAAGCQSLPEGGPRQPAAAPAVAEIAPPSGQSLSEAKALVGEYRVAGVDGATVDLPHGVTSRISADRIDVSAGCIQWAWSYVFKAGQVSTERLPSRSCRRALFPQEQALAEALDAAQDVRRTPANGVEFSGAGRSVLLFSQ